MFYELKKSFFLFSDLIFDFQGRGGWSYSDRVLVYFLFSGNPILDKLFVLCPFMQTVIQHENHVEGFYLTHIQSPEIINSDIIFSLSE